MKRETRSKPFQMRMRPAIKAAGERAAHDSNRSLNSLLETLLIEHLRTNGYLNEQASPKQSRKKS